MEWWLHGEFINLRGAKISKSTGGGVVVSDLIDRGYHPLVYRYLLLQAHYRSQTEFSWEALAGAKTGLRRLLDRFAAARAAGLAELGSAALGYLAAFDQAVCDDLGTPKALAVVAALARDDSLADAELTALAAEFDAVLGLGLTELTPADLDLAPSDARISASEADALVAERSKARARKDFATSDQLRRKLADLGVTVDDQSDGTSSWRWTS